MSSPDILPLEDLFVLAMKVNQQLTQQNQQLVEEKEQLAQQNQQLNKQVNDLEIHTALLQTQINLTMRLLELCPTPHTLVPQIEDPPSKRRKHDNP